MRAPLFRWVREGLTWGRRIGCLVAIDATKIGFALINQKKALKEKADRTELLKWAIPRAEGGYVASMHLIEEMMARAGSMANPLFYRYYLVRTMMPKFLVNAVWYFGKPEVIDITMEEAQTEAMASPADIPTVERSES